MSNIAGAGPDGVPFPLATHLLFGQPFAGERSGDDVVDLRAGQFAVLDQRVSNRLHRAEMVGDQRRSFGFASGSESSQVTYGGPPSCVSPWRSAAGSRCHGQRHSISRTSVQLRKVRTSTRQKP